MMGPFLTGGGGFQAFKFGTQWINISDVCSAEQTGHGEWARGCSSGRRPGIAGDTQPLSSILHLSSTYTCTSEGTDTSLWGRLIGSVTRSQGSQLGRRLGTRLNLRGAARASEKLSARKWGRSWVRGTGLPGQGGDSQEDLKLTDRDSRQ